MHANLYIKQLFHVENVYKKGNKMLHGFLKKRKYGKQIIFSNLMHAINFLYWQAD